MATRRCCFPFLVSHRCPPQVRHSAETTRRAKCRLLSRLVMLLVSCNIPYTPWKTNMEPDNPWLVEVNSLPWDHCQGSMLVFGSVNVNVRLIVSVSGVEGDYDVSTGTWPPQSCIKICLLFPTNAPLSRVVGEASRTSPCRSRVKPPSGASFHFTSDRRPKASYRLPSHGPAAEHTLRTTWTRVWHTSRCEVRKHAFRCLVCDGLCVCVCSFLFSSCFVSV